MAYVELLEPCPPWDPDHHGGMRAIDANHIVVVGYSRSSFAQPGNVSLRAFAVMNTATAQASVFYGNLGYRASRYAAISYGGRYWCLTTPNDYENSGNILVHAIEADGGVYVWETGIFTNLTLGGDYPGAVQIDDWFVVRLTGGTTMKGYSMATATLGSVVLTSATRPIDTSTGVQVTLANWLAMGFNKIGGTLYGWSSNTNTLYTFDRDAWVLTPVTVSAAAAALIAQPTIYVAGKYWSHGTWFSLSTMTGGTMVSGGVGPAALGSDGYIYSITGSNALRVLDPVSGAFNTTTIPNRADRFGVAFSNGKLWCPSGTPYT